jgi:hypothetical protein
MPPNTFDDRPVEDIAAQQPSQVEAYETKETLPPKPEHHEGSTGGRRKSVALNIIENPLKVWVSP